MMKHCRLIAFALALLLCLCAPAVADEPIEYRAGDYRYVLLADGTAEIVAYTGLASGMTLPAELDGYKVTSIGEKAFASKKLSSIIIPEGITSIGDGAFFSCASLTSVTIPDSVVHVGANPFADCSSLNSIRVSPSHPVLATIDGVLFNKTAKELIC